jgi:hypothetical protein
MAPSNRQKIESGQKHFKKATQDVNFVAISTIPGHFGYQKRLASWPQQMETADRYAQ